MALVLDEDLVEERPGEEGPPKDELKGEQKRGILAAYLVQERG